MLDNLSDREEDCNVNVEYTEAERQSKAQNYRQYLQS